LGKSENPKKKSKIFKILGRAKIFFGARQIFFANQLRCVEILLSVYMPTQYTLDLIFQYLGIWNAKKNAKKDFIKSEICPARAEGPRAKKIFFSETSYLACNPL